MSRKSALNHPNILTIYECGAETETHFLASEFIEGETLRARLERAPLALEESLDTAVQAAQALSAAHEASIIHRDIKPENVMIRNDRIVKVLDFGLAKLVEPAPPDAEAETRKMGLTEAGTVMGTVAYMSPEQARGRSVDARSDIWSLGVLIYEMLMRRTPFAGETTNDCIAAILTSEPAPIDENTPPELQRIIRKSLQKKADERYQTVKDFLLDVKNLKRELEFAKELERSQLPASNAGANQPNENQTAILPAATSTQNGLPQSTSSAKYPASRRGPVWLGSIVLLAAIVWS